jgi:serine/threonine protein kinase
MPFNLGETEMAPSIQQEPAMATMPARAEGDPDAYSPAGAEVWREGQVVFDEFVVERELGEGGFGKVYLLSSRKTGERFAVKRALIMDGASRRAFMTELQSWINLPEYPHLVSCRFFRTTDTGIAIFAEYVDGGSLKDWVETGRIYEGGGEQALERLLDVAIQFAWGLGAAHELGLVHQDVKPANVMMTRDGQAKVSDFGLSQGRVESPEVERLVDYLLQDIGEGEALHQVKAAMLGHFAEQDQGKTFEVPHRGALTQAYASPEQAAKAPLTRRTDIWSWGVSILELFNGEITWYSGTLADEVLSDMRHGGPSLARAPRMPEGVAAILEKCFRHNPAERWNSFAEIADALKDVYRTVLRREYARQQPALPERKAQAHGRRLPSGSTWQDPRLWLQRAYEAAGKNAAEAEAHWPERRGSVRAQAISDLKALEHAQEIYEQLVGAGRKEHAADLARLYGSIAMVRRSLDDNEGALRKYEQCVALLRPGTELEERLDLLTAMNGQAILLREMGRREESVRLSDEAIELCRNAFDERPEMRRALATAYLTKANALEDRHQALALYENAARLYAEINEAEGLLKVLGAKAGALTEMGDYAAAHRAYEDAETRLREMIGEGRRLDLEHVLATLMLNRTLCARDERDWPSALRFIEEAIRLYEPLVQERGKTEFEDELGTAYLRRGEVLEALGNPLEACGSYTQARALLSRVVLQDARSESADELARAIQFESNILRNTGQHQPALELAKKSVELWGRLFDYYRENRWRARLAQAQTNLGPILVERGEVEAGLSCINEAVSAFQELMNAEPQSDEYRLGLAGALLELGAIKRKMGDAEGAVRAYQMGLQSLEGSDSTEARYTQSLIAGNLSNALSDLGRHREALDYIDQSIRISEELVSLKGAERHLADLVHVYQNKANKLLRMGRIRETLPLYKLAAPIYEKLVHQAGREDLRFEFFRLLAAQGMAEEKLFDLRSAQLSLKRAIETAQGRVNLPQTPEVTAALQLLQRKILEIEALLNISPGDYAELERRAEEKIEQGKQMGQAGEVAYSCEMYNEAILIYTQLQQREARPRWLNGAANAYVHKAIASMYLGNTEAAEEAFRTAIGQYERLVTEFGQPDLLVEWAKTSYGLAYFLRAENRPAEAVEMARQIRMRLRGASVRGCEEWLTLADELILELDQSAGISASQQPTPVPIRGSYDETVIIERGDKHTRPQQSATTLNCRVCASPHGEGEKYCPTCGASVQTQASAVDTSGAAGGGAAQSAGGRQVSCPSCKSMQSEAGGYCEVCGARLLRN